MIKEKVINYFNEATRVQLPALIHLNRLGYEYIGKLNIHTAGSVYDADTNILLEIFHKQFEKLNPNKKADFYQVLKNIKDELDFNDLGRSFFKKLISISPYKLIDFNNAENNTFHYTAEFTCRNGEDEFRPDITLFINGLPLIYIEVKKPNNKNGILPEKERLESRLRNIKFRRFMNITQLIILSNNMEYDTLDGITPIQGAFYTTISKKNIFLNCFRENELDESGVALYIKNYNYKEVDDNIEKRILKDFNSQILYNTPEYQTNKNINTPTNRIITSMCSKERVLDILLYGIAYIYDEKIIDNKITTRDEKHIIRYQQFFALKSIINRLSNNITSGVIWHTQGSGKTALSYYLHKRLTDYYARQHKVAKFYFIVDRIDLLEQAQQEFKMRGLKIIEIETRKELVNHFRENKSLVSNKGEEEIIVVNIQRFKEDKEKVVIDDYDTKLQRIFIIDEAHRGYNPKGSFLANLLEADKNAIKIALTGTPLLKEERESWRVFGDYIHTYYYDKSIQDGYTLKIMREDIATEYKENLSSIYDDVDFLIQKKDIKKSIIIEHDKYVKALLEYVIKDFYDFRILNGDDSIGGMIVCETSNQARKIYDYFDEIQSLLNIEKPLKVALILYDVEDKETRKIVINDFKKGKNYDILIVYNMLLTGFDAPRLKRLYLCRKLKDHNLLQALTRVNRPYKNNKYGYIVDFADIKKNFDDTNDEYLKELGKFDDYLENESVPKTTLKNLIENKQDILNKVEEIKNIFFDYTTDNLEEFCKEISDIEDKENLFLLRRSLEEAKEYYNFVRTFGDEELKSIFQQINIASFTPMLKALNDRIAYLNTKEMLTNSDALNKTINDAMAYIDFDFKKLSEEELAIISGGKELQEKYSSIINTMLENIDQEDIELMTIKEAFIEKMKNCNFQISSIEEYNKLSKYFEEVFKKVKELNKLNNILSHKFNDDVKYLRIHKRIREENSKRKRENKNIIISEKETVILETLLKMKEYIDEDIYNRNDILNKSAYFTQTVMQHISKNLKNLDTKSSSEDKNFICNKIVKEYLNQYDSYKYI